MTYGNGHPGRDRCGARTRAGGLCQRPAGWGTPTPGVGRCKLHAGSTSTHQVHAARVLIERAEQSALAELHRIGVEPMTNPLEALAELAAEARAWQAILRAQVAELAALVERAPDGVERVRAVVTLYERSLDRTAMFAAMMAKLGIDDRIVKVNARIGEAMGERIAGAITGILEDLGHRDPRRNPAVAPVVVARLGELLAAGDDT
jgi:PAS domain-containing protein